ncbi:hypothetical protein BSLA_01r0648 [Burkholderia stabilis]|nr:hypothetical protein BSLA_01r0648 [Burkholderia stabilis]
MHVTSPSCHGRRPAPPRDRVLSYRFCLHRERACVPYANRP